MAPSSQAKEPPTNPGRFIVQSTVTQLKPEATTPKIVLVRVTQTVRASSNPDLI
jgi:hypothetical protein